MSRMLSRILLAAAPLAGKRPDLTTIPGHKNLVEFTAQRAAAMTEIRKIISMKGPVQSRWLWLKQDHGHGVYLVLFGASVFLGELGGLEY